MYIQYMYYYMYIMINQNQTCLLKTSKYNWIWQLDRQHQEQFKNYAYTTVLTAQKN
jgi:hypothetical protein